MHCSVQSVMYVNLKLVPHLHTHIWSNVDLHESGRPFWRPRVWFFRCCGSNRSGVSFNKAPEKAETTKTREQLPSNVTICYLYSYHLLRETAKGHILQKKNINLSLQLVIFLISWPRLPSQGNDTARVHLGQTHNSPTAPPSKEKPHRPLQWI